VAGSQRRERTAADLAGFKGLGAAVHQLREEKGLTPAQLANNAGLSGSSINAIDRGKQDTTWSNL
jgi:DNA-binding XRE family transcriptional regulator